MSQTIVSPDQKRPERVPPNQSLASELPILDLGRVPQFDPKKWRFRIMGLVKKERQLTYEEFFALPKVTVSSDIHCVTGWSKLDNTWAGVGSNVIRDLVEIRPEAKFVMVYGEDGLDANLSLEDFFGPDVVFAQELDGKPLTPKHGFPVRLVVPRLYFWKSVKWAIAVEFMAQDRQGYWESRGYHNRGDPWEEERFS
jgi:DMSO/TMAO reductase YedYZ molybdopterin-dependent catalytic subunit